jgi:hypothetical protein
MGRTETVRWANGDVATVGGNFTGTYQTQISNTGNGVGFVGYSDAGTGVYGAAGSTGWGVYGAAGVRGVVGVSYNGHGIHGQSGAGWAGYFDGRALTTRYQEFVEIATPGAPPTNHGRLFLRDNGSGHTQLCVKFHNGTVRVLATA